MEKPEKEGNKYIKVKDFPDGSFLEASWKAGDENSVECIRIIKDDKIIRFADIRSVDSLIQEVRNLYVANGFLFSDKEIKDVLDRIENAKFSNQIDEETATEN